MTSRTISILLCGLIFLIIGFLASKHYHWKKFKSYIPIALGMFLIYITTIGPLSESKKRIAEISKINSSMVNSIVLMSTQDDSRKNLTLYKKNRLIKDRSLINEICNTLHKAKVEGDGFIKNPEKVFRVEIRLANKKKIIFGVRKSGSTTCINLYSKGESGWFYTNLKANEFGNLLLLN